MPENQSSSFLKSVARYFMDFLETDFHRRRMPRRTIGLKNSNGQLQGINADKYPAFNKELWRQFSHKFETPDPFTIQRGKYRANIPANLMELIRRKIDTLEKQQIDEVVAEVKDSIENYGVSLKDEYSKALDKIEGELRIVIADNITTPFVEGIEKSLQLLEAAGENITYEIKTELVEIFANNMMPVVETVLREYIITADVEVLKRVKPALTLKAAKALLVEYVEGLASNDLYQELSDIESTRMISDKQELYLYFGDITYQNARFPLFYIPIELEKTPNQFDVSFDSKLYINKKAIEFIAQEVSQEDQSVNGNPADFDRILYLSLFESPEKLFNYLQSVIDNMISYFSLNGAIIFDAERSTARNARIRITNSTYIALFDKSDEALINDYEQILDLEEGSELFAVFENILNGFVTDEPKNISREIETEWDEREVTEKLAFESPVPLNSEQQQIIRALNKEECRFITVEGPPGTGKSHTITALVFNAILQNKSVLVLSDKKEALDVVEDKIKDTLDRVRFNDHFQNPILRLGSKNNFRQILSGQAIENIKLSHRLTSKKASTLEDSIQANLEITKAQVQTEVDTYGAFNFDEMRELERIESENQKILQKLDTQELFGIEDMEVVVHEMRDSLNTILSRLDPESEPFQTVTTTLELFRPNFLTSMTLSKMVTYTGIIQDLVEHIASVQAELASHNWQHVFEQFPDFEDKDLPLLDEFMLRFEKLKRPMLGFSFQKTKLVDLLNEFNQKFGTSFTDPAKSIQLIVTAHTALNSVAKLRTSLPLPDAVKKQFNYLRILAKTSDQRVYSSLDSFGKLRDEAKYLLNVAELMPGSFPDAQNLTPHEFSSLSFMALSDEDAEQLMRWIHLTDEMIKLTDAVPFYSYQQYMETIQKQVTLRMAQILDGRVIDFYTENHATATVVKEVIKSKQKFPKEVFSKLKEAFPCILAGIREYADFIPLEAGLFDLIIIDEASQVSVAQAFPALIRGKQVVIMGDRLQFGNVKSYQARKEINTEYQNRLREAFEKTGSADAASLVKIERLNVKKSILDFAEYVSNYQTMLKKHFRSYPENISFSNRYFYGNALEVMKVRGINIDSVLKFEVVPHDGRQEIRPNSNYPEVEFIISELRKRAENNDTRQSVGIITPHTNQQKLLYDEIRKDPNFDFYTSKLKLKIMTFDTCQGEERDVIYYSMVATKEDDALNYVFPRDIAQSSYDDDSDSEIRRQRLNVGFSRSKETMYFVLSKPVEEFHGSIGVALTHYQNLRDEVKKRLAAEATDENSPMEKKVLDWIYATPFWAKNGGKEATELHAQFELGEYLSQLDPTYHHPKYVVDFILFHRDETGKTFKIIFEYDGFMEHIGADERQYVDGSNFESYLKADDIYRQKVLESYGYEFIRLNRFNTRTEPVPYVNHRIEQLIDGSMIANSVGHDIDSIIRGQAIGLSSGDLKECKNCGQIIPINEFKDSSLATGVGRVCRDCKQKRSAEITSKKESASTGLKCPNCGRGLRLRNGRRGKFYGCSGFPYCKYTTS